jgi:hypothetical protein
MRTPLNNALRTIEAAIEPAVLQGGWMSPVGAKNIERAVGDIRAYVSALADATALQVDGIHAVWAALDEAKFDDDGTARATLAQMKARQLELLTELSVIAPTKQFA